MLDLVKTSPTDLLSLEVDNALARAAEAAAWLVLAEYYPVAVDKYLHRICAFYTEMSADLLRYDDPA